MWQSFYEVLGAVCYFFCNITLSNDFSPQNFIQEPHISEKAHPKMKNAFILSPKSTGECIYIHSNKSARVSDITGFGMMMNINQRTCHNPFILHEPVVSDPMPKCDYLQHDEGYAWIRYKEPEHEHVFTGTFLFDIL